VWTSSAFHPCVVSHLPEGAGSRRLLPDILPAVDGNPYRGRECWTGMSPGSRHSWPAVTNVTTGEDRPARSLSGVARASGPPPPVLGAGWQPGAENRPSVRPRPARGILEEPGPTGEPGEAGPRIQKGRASQGETRGGRGSTVQAVCRRPRPWTPARRDPAGARSWDDTCREFEVNGPPRGAARPRACRRRRPSPAATPRPPDARSAC